MGATGQGANATEGRWLVIPRTLSFVYHGDDVLLMKRGPNRRIFPNRYNGLGGHIEHDEDVWTSARREIKEESGLAVHDLRLRGVHQVDTGEATGIMLFIFTAHSDSRVITESDEGRLFWVHPRDLANLDLVEDITDILARLASTPDESPPWFAHVSYDAADQIVLRYANPVQADES